MTPNEHQLIRFMLVWDSQNPFASMMANFYLGKGRILVDKMLAGNHDWNESAQRNKEIIKFIEEKKWPEASIGYGDMLVDYMTKYWPDCDNVFWKKAVVLYQEAKERMAKGEPVVGVWPTKADGPPPAFPFKLTRTQ